MDTITDQEIRQAEESFAGLWNEASGGDTHAGAMTIAAAVDLAGMRIARALQDVAHELAQLPRE